MALGWEVDRLSEVRPYAHIPGKRKAPKAPDLPDPEEPGARALETSFLAKTSVAKIHSGLNTPDQQVKLVSEPVKPDHLVKVKQFESEKPKDLLLPALEKPSEDLVPKGRRNDVYGDRYDLVEVQSPKPWYKKNPFSFDKAKSDDLVHLHASPSVALKSVKQATKSKTVVHNVTPVRPISLLASISGSHICHLIFDIRH
jgi:hypothetical protein